MMSSDDCNAFSSTSVVVITLMVRLGYGGAPYIEFPIFGGRGREGVSRFVRIWGSNFEPDISESVSRNPISLYSNHSGFQALSTGIGFEAL